MKLGRAVRTLFAVGPSAGGIEREWYKTLRGQLWAIRRIQRVVSELVRIRLGAY